MSIDLEGDDLNKFILVGDRVLIKPKNPPKKTKSGLYLPPGIEENEKIHSGYVVKVGPGYPIPNMLEVDEPWMKKAEQLKFIPLQKSSKIILFRASIFSTSFFPVSCIFQVLK